MGEMLALEVEVVKKKTLSEAIQVLQGAKKIDAKKLAPKTWKIAEDTLKQSTVFIESYPRDEEGVKKAGLDALRASQHTYFVTKETLILKETDKDGFENVVLDMESKLDRISLGLNHPDVRYMSLHDQSVTLGNAAEAMSRNVVTSEKKNTTMSKTTEKKIIEKAPPKAPEAVSVDAVPHSNTGTPVISEERTNKVDESITSPEKQNTSETAPDVLKDSPTVTEKSETKAPENDIESIKSQLQELENKL